jgi:uncharacterized membrane protein
MKLLLILLAISYPVLVHAAAISGSERLIVACIALLGTLLIAPGLRAGRRPAWLAVPIILIAIVLLARAHAGWLPLYAPPILINSFLAWLFGRTLRRDESPLIERLARLMHDPAAQLDPAIPGYARRLTFAWTALFCTMALLNLVLALCVVPSGILALLNVDPPVEVSLQTWSLFANVLNYLIAGGFFLAEYAYRQRRFPNQPYRNLFDFIRRATALSHRALSPRQR